MTIVITFDFKTNLHFCIYDVKAPLYEYKRDSYEF